MPEDNNKCPLKDHQIAGLVNAVTKEVSPICRIQSLRVRVSKAVKAYLKGLAEESGTSCLEDDLEQLTGISGWESVDGPKSGVGVDYWFIASGGHRAYVNIDQGHRTICVDGEPVLEQDTE